jgi:DNA (cytosine-5)-methyltransferase 1
MKLTYVDFFAGIGGFRYGIEEFARENPKYTFKCIATVDIKKDALETYNLNFSENNEPTDIRTVSGLPKFDILCGGFPCQPFSSAGKREGFSDDRGGLIFEVLRICKESTPKYILLENVANIEKLENGRVLERILEEFQKIGYNTTYKLINSQDVGLAQDRARIYIVCTLKKKINLEVPEPAHRDTIASIIDTEDIQTDIPESFVSKLMNRSPEMLYGKSIKDKRGGDDNLHSWDIDYHGPTSDRQKELMSAILRERRKKKWAESKGIKWMDGMPLTLEEIKTFKDYPEIQADLDDLTEKGYLVLEHPKDAVNGKRVYTTNSPKGYNICKGKLSFPISKILHPEGFCPTLTATDSSKLAVIVQNTIRRLNQREMNKLCGFPSTMKLPAGVDMYDLYGNMVCPPVVTAILRCVLL